VDLSERVVNKLEALLERAEALMPPAAPRVDWGASAFRWRRTERGGMVVYVRPVAAPGGDDAR